MGRSGEVTCRQYSSLIRRQFVVRLRLGEPGAALAAEAGTSVSNLVANFLRTVAADTDDEFARLVALQRQVQSSVVGFSARDNVSRDEAHDRAPR